MARLRDKIPEPGLGFSITEGITLPGCPGGARDPTESTGACRACLECCARPGLEGSPLRLRGRRSAWLGSGRSGPRRAALTLTVTPTGEDRRKVCEEVGGYGEDGAAGDTLAPCAPRGSFSPGQSRGALPSGSPRAAPRACPRCLAGKGCRAVAAAADSAPLGCAEDARVPNGGNPARPDPTATTPAGCSSGGRTARTACGAGAELPGGGRSAAAGAASHPPRRARSFARPAALALPPLARPLSAAARSSRTQ